MRDLIVVLALTVASAEARAAETFELKDGDRVVLIGNTLIEREQQYGYWEAALTTRWPDRNITFRNLGWSGDTVWGEARAGFGSQADGFRHLKEHVLALKPTVIIIGYGGNEAFAGPAGLPRFADGMKKLLEALAPTKARIVLLSPPRVDEMPPPLPNPAEHNKNLAQYRDIIRSTAVAGGHRFVDLFELSSSEPRNSLSRLTDNGVHYNAEGYRVSAAWLEKGLGLPARKAQQDWNPKLLMTIIAKNEQYFHRWRPQNETYLLGFRKHEQGQNAREIPLFDPIVAKLEAEIAQLRRY